MSVFVNVSFFHVAVTKSESAEQKSVGFSNWHAVDLFDGVAFSSFLKIFYSSVNIVIHFLNFNRDRLSDLVGRSMLFFTRFYAITEDSSSSVKFSKQTVNRFTLFRFILFVKVENTFNCGRMAS